MRNDLIKTKTVTPEVKVFKPGTHCLENFAVLSIGYSDHPTHKYYVKFTIAGEPWYMRKSDIKELIDVLTEVYEVIE